MMTALFWSTPKALCFTLKTSDVEAYGFARNIAYLVDEAAKDVLAGISRPKRKDWTPAKPLEHGVPSPEEIRFAADSMYVGLTLPMKNFRGQYEKGVCTGIR